MNNDITFFSYVLRTEKASSEYKPDNKVYYFKFELFEIIAISSAIAIVIEQSHNMQYVQG